MMGFILAIGLAGSALVPSPSVPHYRLSVEIDPASHHIVVEGRIDGHSCDEPHRLYLNRALRLTRFRVAGHDAAVRMDTAAKPAPWTRTTRPLVFECRPGPIELSYEGALPDTVSEVNLIAADLVELAGYTGWYPMDPAVPAFTYDLQLTLPAGWVVASGGRVRPGRAAGGRQTTRIVTEAPGMDIAFVASPGLVLRRARSGSATVEVYSVTADSALAEGAVANLQHALDLYSGWFGPPGTGSLPTRFVYSPRGGWGYSRLPLMIVSAAYARDLAGKPLGNASILQGTAHELGHFWWQIADTKTPDDWINEGGAEYSAFSAATRLFGGEIRDSLLARYRRDAARARTGTPIAATTNQSPDRYINHYEKPTLLFAAVERTTGSEKLLAFLRSFHAAHAGGRRDATTAAFLADARSALGEDVAARIERCVTGAWTPDCAD